MRIGHGYDVHRLVPGRKLILGGVEIPFERGLDGHSDADVLTHALMDALLGAACLGDIGLLFPDNDPQYKGISSLLLLEEVVPILPLDQDSARVRRQQAVYQLQHGGLSAAGPADDRHKCARLHIQREVPQNGLGAEGLGDAFKANDRLGHITPPAGPSGAGSPWPRPARPGPPPPPGS